MMPKRKKRKVVAVHMDIYPPPQPVTRISPITPTPGPVKLSITTVGEYVRQRMGIPTDMWIFHILRFLTVQDSLEIVSPLSREMFYCTQESMRYRRSSDKRDIALIEEMNSTQMMEFFFKDTNTYDLSTPGIALKAMLKIVQLMDEEYEFNGPLYGYIFSRIPPGKKSSPVLDAAFGCRVYVSTRAQLRMQRKSLHSDGNKWWSTGIAVVPFLYTCSDDEYGDAIKRMYNMAQLHQRADVFETLAQVRPHGSERGVLMPRFRFYLENGKQHGLDWTQILRICEAAGNSLMMLALLKHCPRRDCEVTWDLLKRAVQHGAPRDSGPPHHIPILPENCISADAEVALVASYLNSTTSTAAPAEHRLQAVRRLLALAMMCHRELLVLHLVVEYLRKDTAVLRSAALFGISQALRGSSKTCLLATMILKGGVGVARFRLRGLNRWVLTIKDYPLIQRVLVAFAAIGDIMSFDALVQADRHTNRRTPGRGRLEVDGGGHRCLRLALQHGRVDMVTYLLRTYEALHPVIAVVEAITSILVQEGPCDLPRTTEGWGSDPVEGGVRGIARWEAIYVSLRCLVDLAKENGRTLQSTGAWENLYDIAKVRNRLNLMFKLSDMFHWGRGRVVRFMDRLTHQRSRLERCIDEMHLDDEEEECEEEGAVGGGGRGL